jgi:hypothetical protein
LKAKFGREEECITLKRPTKISSTEKEEGVGRNGETFQFSPMHYLGDFHLLFYLRDKRF